MFQQVTDFREESDALHRLLEPLDDADFERRTRFKGWTINEIIGHLHMWNWAADLSLHDPDALRDFLAGLMRSLGSEGLRPFEREWRRGLAGRALRETWRDFYPSMSDRFARADPRARVPWAGPDMSVRSSMTARLMETWAHGQAIYDLLGVVRTDTDRIRNIAVLGINTFAWTFRNRGLDVPQRAPHVRLTAPSGAVWEFDEPSETECIEGSATEFCQVVTQTRNIADTHLDVRGDTAARWMSVAQCFAGPPEDPPAAGTRFTARG